MPNPDVTGALPDDLADLVNECAAWDAFFEDQNWELEGTFKPDKAILGRLTQLQNRIETVRPVTTADFED